MADITAKLASDYDYFLRYATKLAGKECAQDIVQDAFVKAISIPEETVNYARTWFCTIIRNLYIDALRKQIRHPYFELGGDIADTSMQPDLCYAELCDELEGLAEKNSSPTIKIFRDYALYGATRSELASKYRMGVKKVNSRMHLARGTLKKKLRKFI